MDRFKPEFRAVLVCKFASSLRIGEHYRSHQDSMTKLTVQETIDQVGACFRENFRSDPQKGLNGKQCPAIKLKSKGHQNLDPRTKQ